jgi:ABC-type glutathione transport system ATPase component
MSTFNIIKEIKFNKTFRNQKIIDEFDLNSENYKEIFKGEIDLDIDWKIGLIYGSSGSGKTTIGKELFKEKFKEQIAFNNKLSIMDNMPKGKSVDEITKIFNQVGFSSPISWLKPPLVLSNGEKMRVNLAYQLLNDEELIIFDEFTSVVDRNVAKTMCLCLNKILKKINKKIIFISCHYDILEWLNTDWSFDTNLMKYSAEKKTQKSNRDSKSEKEDTKTGNCLGNITI